ncbi:S8 family serine peptidase [Neolewinella lacunae]|uniref:S8 family serine peptidase n=1 Tax=Neolewinella lacunae TaxID=1517758 RepID=A0A923PMP2_9BACT|nr:S8 family serine peptidase [Neolewinella lacunae]MBC6995240.1 S8 family serine peptidase [Neolewinella lacunae]MDN3635451.1 S8 family serine peptidase [Neolewinella lacunae]
MRILLAALLLCLSLPTFAQKATPEGAMYFVGFADKAGTPFRIDEPTAFLGEKALQRRQLHGSAITELDLPVSPAYVSGVQQTGAQVWLKSKWMNGVVVAAKEEQVAALKKLPFVREVYLAAPKQYTRSSALPVVPNLDRPAPSFEPVPVNPQFYGYGWQNLDNMEGDSLHHWGFRGKGVLVAVFDGGFPSVNYKDFLGYADAAAVPANYDLVEQDDTALDGSTHGSTVLSTMAAHHPFFFVGTAPDARYVLFKTENGRGEHRLEEINYAIALEIADSIGVDVVNSSLGYTTFGMKEMDYTAKDLDGKTSPASIAIGHAFARGMIIVTSAGNSGGDDWKYIGTPADAPDALSIGALNDDGTRAYFSSFGPTADGRTKPDVSALGVSVAAITASGRGLTAADGTSLASPLVAGLVACLRQAVPTATNRELLDAIRATADQAAQPDNERGYGRPNFAAAYRLLQQARKR